MDWRLPALELMERDRWLARRLPAPELVEAEPSLARRQLSSEGRPAPATGSTADSAGSGPDGTSYPVRSGATAQRPATTATSLPHDGTRRCNIDNADGLAERIARTL
jgi:hypothetical protein